MKLIQVSKRYERFNSEEFINAFNAGARQQYEADLKEIERPKGKWVEYEFGNERWHKCSVCGKADEYINNLGLVAVRNYCPNCGAYMKEE